MSSQYLLKAGSLAAIAFLAACSGGRESGPSAMAREEATEVVGGLFAGPELWHDPQLSPHPAYNYPTLNHPPEGELPEYWQAPSAPMPASISKMNPVGTTMATINSSAGFAPFGRVVVLPGFGNNTHIVDIGDPANPKMLSRLPETNHRGVTLVPYPDGRLIAVFANNSTLPYYDITNPRRPKMLGEVSPAQGNHNVGVVPGTPIIYNAATDGGSSNLDGAGTGFTEIYDFSDPENPILVQNFPNGYSCHDVRFWLSREQNRYRAICAGVEYTQIWDIEDPLNPEVIVSVPVHHGVPGTPSMAVSPIFFSHYANLNMDGSVLIVGDETGGGSLPPGCVAHADTPIGGGSTPEGALVFYDISDETNPTLAGWFSPNKNLPQGSLSSCTVHFGRLIPDPEGRDLITIGAYGAGILIIDFSNRLLPHVVDQYLDGHNSWEAWYHNGFILGGGLNRGLDILTLE